LSAWSTSTVPWLLTLRPQVVSRSQLDRYRDRRLRRLVEHAYRNVPYYRSLFDANGLQPRHIQTVADIERIPISSRTDIQTADPRDVVARGIDPDRLMSRTTSGSSGQPLTVRRTWLEDRAKLVSNPRLMLEMGLRPRDRRVSIAHMTNGRTGANSAYVQLANAFGMFRHRWIDCTLQREEIVDVLVRCRPDFLGGYPGTISHVAEIVTPEQRAQIGLRIIAVGGEVLTPRMRRRITDAFGARVWNYYASHEFAMIAWECGETGQMHVRDDGLIVEVLKDGRPVEPGERGEVVATNLDSFAMPFIRYRLGDMVTKGSHACPCGRPFGTLHSIDGRILDYFPLPDGRMLHPYELIHVIVHDAMWISRYQFVQERQDRIVLHVIPRDTATPEQLADVQRRMEAHLGPLVELQIRLVRDIPLGPNGKSQVARSLLTDGAAH